MLTLFEQIDKGTLWRSIGGIHPPESKTLSNRTCIASLALADEYVVPLNQVGESSVLAVSEGDYVTKGMPLTRGTHFGHLSVHAPTSGHVTKIEQRPSNHASGLPVLSCVISPDGLDTLDPNIHAPLSWSDIASWSNEEILKKIQDAGIAGLGGAAFPTHIKLNPASDIELLIINAIECEPYITADDVIMREHSDAICLGIAIIHRLLQPKRLIIAIEDNKPEAIEEMHHALNRSQLPKEGVRITSVPTLYPSGGEKQLIQILTGQEVPSGSIPAHLGIVVQNVATSYAIKDAVLRNYPLIERVVTVTGNNTSNPGNYWVPIGTPISHLLTQTGFRGNETDKVIIGGPMMGYALYNDSAPIIKGSNCLLLPDNKELAPEQKELPCVRCGECAQVCPALLLPQQLFWHAKAKEYDKAANFNLADCIECGCCTYVCPSNIPLVEYYRIAKSAVKTEAEEKKQAELAKQRFELRTQRLEDERLAREAKQKEAAERRKANMSGSDKDAVAEAMARIKAKKAASGSQEVTNTAKTSDSKRKDVSAAIARAKAKKAAQSAPDATENSTSSAANPAADDRKAQIAAAVARAKAKKSAPQASETDSSDEPATPADAIDIPPNVVAPVDDRKAKIATAVARAKAKKAAQLAPETDSIDSTAPSVEVSDEPQEAPAPADDRKAKIAAAVARAKAKKAAQLAPETDSIDSTAPSVEVSNEPQEALVPADDRKAKIAAAVAKAKAKKTAQQAPETDSTDSTAPSVEVSNEPQEAPPPVDDKKARVAAAVARAKAKKAAQHVSQADSGVEPAALVDANDASQEAPALVDDKKARIAAAVAKAKAKKAMLKTESEKE
ncbi:electron transport complex subunit RsxC [Shewanella atlantica]|uniref:Ion-translocating oxidoreductase complex subunit C n=1 Tax=Shewanella atlantica TaxID=271099 RepID=A0A3S0IXR1_9GAMM|nr:electron transport complex subunit RsxC [Shewanella atlantica]RTR33696.1 electron transport complex subunit RsxC [Shewanella atlantica]